MLAKVDGLCAERDRQRKEQRVKYPGTDKAINGPAQASMRSFMMSTRALLRLASAGGWCCRRGTRNCQYYTAAITTTPYITTTTTPQPSYTDDAVMASLASQRSNNHDRSSTLARRQIPR